MLDNFTHSELKYYVTPTHTVCLQVLKVCNILHKKIKGSSTKCESECVNVDLLENKIWHSIKEPFDFIVRYKFRLKK